jgi:hypothetical protein
MDRAELRSWYERYRRRQARRLLDILPREAVRPLHRAATTERADGDPLERLVTFCAELLPLPPFEVWAADLARHPEAHLREWEDSSEVPTAEDPATLAVRELRRGPEHWTIRLRGYAQAGGWRAFLAYQGPALGDAHHTAAIFHEATASALRDRFQTFDDGVLESFLRSCLP